MSGHVGNLSEKQESLLEKFRNDVQDVLRPKQIKDDYFLLRWLRARKFDLKQSETMLRNSMEWRKKYRADMLLEEFKIPEVIKKYLTGGNIGFDKDGSVVWYDPFGLMDMKGLLHAAKKADIVRTKVYELEKMCMWLEEKSRQIGKRLETLTYVIDMENVGLRHLWKPGMDVLKEVFTIYENNYPEILKLELVINAPKIFPILFNIFKPILSEETMSKINIIGADYKNVLLKHIDADQIPVYWGGTCADPDGDPRCVSRICFGGTVPESYYCLQPERDATFTDVVVGRGSSLQLDYEILVPLSVIRWQFSTQEYDIGFGVFRRTRDCRQKAREMEEILASDRVNSHLVSEDGAIRIYEPGTYVIRFDNTFCLTWSKSLTYAIEILPPDDSEVCQQQSENETSQSDNSEELQKHKESDEKYSSSIAFTNGNTACMRTEN